MHLQKGFCHSLMLLSLTSAATARGVADQRRQVQDACEEFNDKWPNITYFPGSTVYTNLSEG